MNALVRIAPGTGYLTKTENKFINFLLTEYAELRVSLLGSHIRAEGDHRPAPICNRKAS